MKKTFTHLFLFTLLLAFVSQVSLPVFAEVTIDTEDTVTDSLSSTCLDIRSPSLSYGMTDRTTNGEVSLLQDFLAEQGLLRGSYSGSFGTKTRTAVMAYQARKGVVQVGRVGALTKKLITEETCGSPIGDADDNGPYTYTNPNTPVSFTLSGAINNQKTVTPTDSLTFNWSTPGATSYKFKADLPDGSLNDKEFPTTLTTWTGTIKDLLNIASGSAALSVSGCTTSTNCTAYSTPITVTVQASTQTNTPSVPSCTTSPKEYYYYYNPDVKNAGVDAIKHWNDFGMKEGRRACWTTLQNEGGTSSGAGTSQGGVPQVTIQATPFTSTMSMVRDLVLITWTATNNPSYCTGSDGGKSAWSAYKNNIKVLPSSAASYSQLIDLTEFYQNPVDYTFGITCTNAYGTSQIVSTTLKDTAKIFGTHAGAATDPSNWPASWPAAWKKGDGFFPRVNGHRQLDDEISIQKYNSRSVRDVLHAGSDVKVCKRVFPANYAELQPELGTTHLIIANPTTSPPCTQDSDFIPLMGQPGWVYNDPNSPYIKAGTVSNFTRNEVGGYSAANDIKNPNFISDHAARLDQANINFADGRPIPSTFWSLDNIPSNQYYVFKSSNGGVFAGNWGYIGGFGPEYGDAWAQYAAAPTVTKLNAVSPAPNTVTLTWISTNYPERCFAYPNEVAGWAGANGTVKSAPTSTGTRSQTLTVAKPGTYTFEMRCTNAYSIGYPVTATVTVSGQTITP